MKKLSLFLAMLMLFALVSGCASSSYNTSYAETAVSAPESPKEEAMMEEEMMEDSAAMASGADSGDAPAKQDNYDEKIIYSAWLEMETTTFDDTTSAVEGLVKEYDGFVENSSVRGNTVYRDDGTIQVVGRYAMYTLRIPSDKFEAVLSQAGTLGNVVSANRQAENITSAFRDQEALKTSLEVQEERLIHMMEQSEDIETLIALESRISDVRYEIDSITRQLTNWQRDVDYSTVEIGVQEVELYTPTAPVQRTFGEKLRDNFQSGIGSFAYGVQSFVLMLVANVFQLLVFAVVVVVVVVIIRTAVRKRVAKGKKAQEPKDET